MSGLGFKDLLGKSGGKVPPETGNVLDGAQGDQLARNVADRSAFKGEGGNRKARGIGRRLAEELVP
jgi:hypothetical protein